jgi:predicted phosphodiesterase
MRLQILSDLHLSTGAVSCPDTGADLVILAGDLGRPATALEWARGLGRPALYVPGNHEFYGGSLDGTVAELRRLSQGGQVSVLSQDARVIGGVRFLGTTLWTDFRLFDDSGQRAAAMEAGSRFTRDFSRIRLCETDEALFTPAHSTTVFDAQVAWLKARLDEPFEGPTVVITHHPPSRGSIHPRFEGSLINACFASDADHLLDGARVDLWIHGHMHDSFDYVRNGTRVVCNPRGYNRQGVAENPHFDPAFTIELG